MRWYDVLVASLDEKTNVGVHERNGHRYVSTVREHEVGMKPHLLDEREDVCPKRKQESAVRYV